MLLKDVGLQRDVENMWDNHRCVLCCCVFSIHHRERPETAGKTNVEEADLFFDSQKCGCPVCPVYDR